MVLDRPGTRLRPADLPEPVPGPGQVLLNVRACGVCRTDLHVTDGEVEQTHSPLVLGHQVVARREDTGARVGVPWLGWTDGTCPACRRGQENLCESARFTGKDLDGGFAERTVADERFCLALPDDLDDVHAAPLLCAGLIGLRTLRAAGDPARLGLYGFGAAAHLVSQIAVWEGREVYAFTRAGDARGQAFAREQGAAWAGDSTEPPPEPLDAALIFAPAGELVPLALRAVRPGGVVVCGGIHMSDIPSFPYADLWGERVLRSVANLTRADGHELLSLAPRVPLRPQVTTYPLQRAQDALDDLRSGALEGAAVVVP
jgi:alcohol dehydrogenase, propanol-preferring